MDCWVIIKGAAFVEYKVFVFVTQHSSLDVRFLFLCGPCLVIHHPSLDALSENECISHWLTCCCGLPWDILCMKYIRTSDLSAPCRLCFSHFLPSQRTKNPAWQRGNGASYCGQPLCGFFTTLKLQKQFNFALVRRNGSSTGGQCAGGLIMETEVSRDKSISLSNRESPLLLVFLCLMHRPIS